MLGFSSLAQSPLAALPQGIGTSITVTGFQITSYLGSVSITGTANTYPTGVYGTSQLGSVNLVLWSSVLVPDNSWTPINIFNPN